MNSKKLINKNRNNEKKIIGKNYSGTNPIEGSLTESNTEKNSSKSYQEKIITNDRDQIKDALKEHFSASAMGFKQRYRKTLKHPPEWITILHDAGISEKDIINNIRNDDILEFFNNEEIVFKLTDDEMSQIKSLIKDQITLESDLELGIIKGSDEVYNVISNLAKNNGDLSKMSSKDQVAVLTLVQFNNITPSFGDDYNENAIELCLEGGNDFIEFVDIMGSEIYVRKSSFVKAQIMEEKIIDELTRFKTQSDKKSSFMVFCGVLYFGIKIFIFILAWMYLGNCNGFLTAMQEVNAPKRSVTL